MRILSVILLLFIAIDSIFAVCNNLPPGIERVIRGIDASQLDLTPSELTLSNGFNHPVIEFTCTTGRTWKNPSDPTGPTYNIPDEVEVINSLPGGIVDFKTHVYMSHTDVKKTTTGGGGASFLGLFSASASYKKTQQTIVDNLNSLIEMSAYVSAYELQMKPYLSLKLSPTVTQFLDQLPATYQANPGKYQEFIDTFGSHFFNSGLYGGFLSTKVEVTETLIAKMTEKELAAEAGGTFLGLLKLHGGYNGGTAKVSDDFKKYSSVHEAYYGGNANLMASGTPSYGVWWQSVPRNPWLFGGQLVPIANLVPAGPKRDGIAVATQVRLDKAYLDDVTRSLDYLLALLYMQKRELAKEKAQGVAYLAQVNALKAQVVPNHAQVESLGPVIDNYVINERNKAAKACVADHKYCHSNLIHFYESTSSFYNSYINKTTFGFNPIHLDSL